MPETQDQNKEKQPLPFRSGTIAIVGRPNVGNESLRNQIPGEKAAIVPPKPQTTRNRVTGIRTSESSQMVFLDTPGIRQARSLINRRMVDVALARLHEVDCVLWLLAAQERIGAEDERIAETLAAVAHPGFVPLN